MEKVKSLQPSRFGSVVARLDLDREVWVIPKTLKRVLTQPVMVIISLSKGNALAIIKDLQTQVV